MNQTTVTQLKSGLRVVTIPIEGAASVTVLALVGVGSRYEPKNLWGISHFLEHMPFKGTKKWSSSKKLSTAVDGVGAYFNAYTSKEYTGFYVKSAARHVKLSLDVVSDLLYAPLLREKDIEKEKGVIVEEINMYNDVPRYRVAHLFDKVAFGNSGLGRRIDGSRETVTALTQADFVGWRQKWYGLQNVVVVVAGNVKSQKSKPISKNQEANVLNLVEEYFVGKAGEMEKVNGVRKLVHDMKPGVEVEVENMKSDQAHLILGFPGLRMEHPDRYAQALLDAMIGDNMSSRLFIEVRERRGLAYYISSEADKYLDTGMFCVSAGVDITKIKEAIKATMKVFEDVTSNGRGKITEAELKKAKEYYAGKIALSLEDNSDLARYWGLKAVLGDEAVDPEELVRRVRAVTLDDVQRLAKSMFKPDQVKLAVVGPYEDGEELRKILSK